MISHFIAVNAGVGRCPGLYRAGPWGFGVANRADCAKPARVRRVAWQS